MMHDQPPPSDKQAEQIVLGGMLLSADQRTDIPEILTAADFYDPRHGEIYSTILHMDSAGQPVDMATVSTYLADTGYLSRLPSTTYLVDLVEAVPTAANASWFARRVRDLARRRESIAACLRGIQLAHNMEMDPDSVIEKIQAEIHSATTGVDSDDLVPWSVVADSVMDETEAASETEGTVRGLSTGLVDLDGLLGGLRPGQFILTAGRPGMGKTVLLTDIARRNAFKDGKRVALFSLEMTKLELGQRIASAETSIALSLIKRGDLTESQWRDLAEHRATTDRDRLHINDTKGQTLAEIRAKARRLQQRQGLDLVLIDYLQLIRSAHRVESRQVEISEISRGVKEMAGELNVPVIAAAQLNRGPEQRPDRKPQLADLRDSGSLEQDCDVAILLHRPAYYDRNTPRKSEIDLIVEKNRHGATDTVVGVAQLHRSRIVNSVPKYQSPVTPGMSGEDMARLYEEKS